MDETWKDINGYEGLYQVSSLGRVKALQKEIDTGIGIRVQDEMILKPDVTKFGYLRVTLYRNCSKKRFTVHRLVASEFIPNPKGLPEVNHKHGIKSDNRVTKLEWVSRSDNEKHAHSIGLKFGMKGKLNPTAKLVLNIENGIYYDTAKEAAIADGIRYTIFKQRIRNNKRRYKYIYV